MINLSGENIVLVGALLLFVAVLAGKVAYRFGAPALLLFLGVGMLFGLDFISYRSVDITPVSYTHLTLPTICSV